MDAGSSEGCEASLAALLAQTLGDEAWWALFAAAPDDRGWRDLMAARAIELYRRTNPVVESRITAAEIAPIDRALGAVREIADAAAMFSHRWTSAEREELRIPTRALIELGIRLFEVDDWADGLGYPLDVPDSGVPEEAWSDKKGRPVDEWELDLAPRFLTATESYDTVLTLRDRVRGRALLRSEEFRKASCQEIGDARAWLVWTRGHLPTHAELVAVATLLIAQAIFVSTWEETADDGLFPSKEWLRSKR